MKGKYITTQILLACPSGKRQPKTDIYEQLKETLTEREHVLEQMRRQSRLAKAIDMYLKEYKIA